MPGYLILLYKHTNKQKQKQSLVLGRYVSVQMVWHKDLSSVLRIHTKKAAQVDSWLLCINIYSKTVLLKTPYTVAAGHRGMDLKPTRKTPPCWAAVVALGVL